MKRIFFSLVIVTWVVTFAYSQENMVKTDLVVIDSSMTMKCESCYKNTVSAGGRYYFSPLKNSVTSLGSNGFVLDETALEYQVRLFNLPKIFYYQQLGTLTNTNYVSVTGFGVKEDLRYNIIKNSTVTLAPYVELGGGYYRMNIAKGVVSNSISSVLGSEVENYFLDNFVLSGDLGLEIGVGFKIEDRRLNVLFNGGYMANVPAQWRMAGSLAFKEKLNFSSPYAGVTLRLEMECKDCCEPNCK